MLEDLTENEITLNDFINGVDVVEVTCVEYTASVIIDDCLSRGKKIVKKELLTVALYVEVEKDLVENSLFYALPESHKVLLDT